MPAVECETNRDKAPHLDKKATTIKEQCKVVKSELKTGATKNNQAVKIARSMNFIIKHKSKAV